jgi:ComEC/Rec2-related protein
VLDNTFIPSPPNTALFLTLGAIFLLSICCFVLARWESFSQNIKTTLYWGSSIYAGLIIGQAAFERITSTDYTFPPEMDAIVQGEVVEIVRRDSTPTAHILSVILRGNIDAEPLPRLHDERILLRIIFSHNKPDKPSTDTTLVGMQHDSLRQTVLLRPHHIHAGTSIYAAARIRLPATDLLPTDIQEVQYARTLDVHWLGTVQARNCAALGESFSVRSRLHAFIETSQEWLTNRINTLFPTITAPFALALLTGNTRHLGAETRAHYARAGTAHVLAVSGLHLAVIASGFFIPLGFVRQRWIQFLLFIVLVGAFVAVTGLAASAVRAGVMACMAMLIRTIERRTEVLNLLAFSVICLLAIVPTMLFSIGFQMSVAAVAGIAVIMPFCERFFARITGQTPDRMRLQRNILLKNIVQSLSLTIAASVVVAPIAAAYFHTFSLIAPLTNLVIVPISSVAMLYTMASVGMSVLWWDGGVLLAQTAHYCLRCMDALNTLAAHSSISAIVGRWALFAACGASLLVLYVITSSSARMTKFRVSASIGAVLCALWGIHLWSKLPPTRLHIYPRKHITAASMQNGRTYTLLLQDRRLINPSGGMPSGGMPTGRIPSADMGFERFISEYELTTVDSLMLCVTGPASMVIASRILQEQSVKNIHTQLLVTSLLYKGSRWFQALDSAQARANVMVNAASYLHRDSSFVLYIGVSERQDSVRIVWHPWRAGLEKKYMEKKHMEKKHMEKKYTEKKYTEKKYTEKKYTGKKVWNSHVYVLPRVLERSSVLED